MAEDERSLLLVWGLVTSRRKRPVGRIGAGKSVGRVKRRVLPAKKKSRKPVAKKRLAPKKRSLVKRPKPIAKKLVKKLVAKKRSSPKKVTEKRRAHAKPAAKKRAAKKRVSLKKLLQKRRAHAKPAAKKLVAKKPVAKKRSSPKKLPEKRRAHAKPAAKKPVAKKRPSPKKFSRQRTNAELQRTHADLVLQTERKGYWGPKRKLEFDKAHEAYVKALRRSGYPPASIRALLGWATRRRNRLRDTLAYQHAMLLQGFFNSSNPDDLANLSTLKRVQDERYRKFIAFATSLGLSESDAVDEWFSPKMLGEG